MSENPEMQVQMVSSHGMLAILEVLEGRCSRDVIMKLLQIINLVGRLHCQPTCHQVFDINFRSWSERTSASWRASV